MPKKRTDVDKENSAGAAADLSFTAEDVLCSSTEREHFMKKPACNLLLFFETAGEAIDFPAARGEKKLREKGLLLRDGERDMDGVYSMRV